MDVGNFISGSSACSKCSLNISKFSAHVLLKLSLENLEHYLANACVECNFVVVWTYFGNDFLWNWVTDIFQFYGHCWVCQICWHIVFITFTPSSFRIWNSSTGIPPPPLALLIVILPKAHLTSHSRMSGTRWVITASWSSGSWRYFFCIVLLCILATIIIQFSSVTQLCPTLWDPMNCKMQASLSITNSWSLPKLMSIESVMPSTISSSVIPFSSCFQSFPASESFQMSQLFTSGGQSIGVSASKLVLTMNTQDWSSLEWTGWISLQFKELSRVISNTTVQKHWFFYFVDKIRQLQGRTRWTECSEQIHQQATHITL